jgi:hypothetical protein
MAAANDAIVGCMDRAGFPNVIKRTSEDTAPDPAVTGYGITTRVGVAAFLNGAPPPLPDGLDLVGKLEPAAFAALVGPSASDDERPSGKVTFGAGCLAQGQDAAAGGDVEAFDQLDHELEAMDAEVQKDSGVVAAQAKWATCFESATQTPMASSDEAQQRLAQELSDLLNPPTTSTAGAPVSPGSTATIDQAETSRRSTALSALQAKEVQWAAADTSCTTRFVDPAREPVKARLAVQLYSRHRALFERLGLRP